MARRQTVNQSSYAICGDKPKFRTSSTAEQKRFCTFGTCKNLGFIVRDQSQNLRFNVKNKRNLQKENWLLEFKIMAKHQKSAAIMAHSSYKYFRRPIVPFLVPKAQNIELPVHFEHDTLNDIVQNAQKQCYIFPPKSESHKTVGTQTDYRDSETQTSPWEPPYKIRLGHNPETLTIAHLTWNHGLPAGIHEVEIINRMRMKRAWEAILPPMDTSANIKIRTAIISALEVDEWAFRESEIQAIMDYRLKVMEEISRMRECEQQKKVEGRFDRLKDSLAQRRDKEVNGIRHNLRRELRKLHKKHQTNERSSKRDIIREHADPSSQLYAPQMRFGEHPGRRHEVIRKDLLKESYIESKCTDQMDTIPSWLPTYEELKAIKPKPKPADLCIRETRWTEEKLKQLHEDLKAIRLNVRPIETLSLMKRKYKSPSLPSTPYRSITENSEDVRMDQLSTLIQKTIRGRAIQCMMFEGRDRCRELIEELQSTHALEERSKKRRQKEKMQMIDLQRLQNDKSVQEDHVCEILNSLEGMTVSGMLDFLSKELIRLEDERRAHAFALLAERERCMREAAEAGRRQLEQNRRREFDEMFTEIIKINQDSVETYLEDIIKEGIEWVSDEAAKEYILKLSDKVDSISRYAAENATELAQEEMVANMIYNFVLPEVEKDSVRRNIRENQQSYLRNAHVEIYEQILNLPSIEDIKFFDEEDGKMCRREDSIDPLHLNETEESGPVVHTAETEIGSVGMAALRDVKSILETIISTVVADDIEIIHDLLESIITEVTEYEGLSLESSNSSSENDNIHE